MRLLILSLFISINCMAQSEPIISIYQGSEPGMSVVVVKWPDNVEEKLLYKNLDLKDKKDDTYIKWFNDRLDAYEKRNSK